MKKSLNELHRELKSYNIFFIDTVKEMDQYITTDENIKKVMNNPVTCNIPYNIVWVCTIQYKNGRIHNNKIIPAFIKKHNIDHSVFPNRESYSLIGIGTYNLISKFSETLGINSISTKELNKKKVDLSFNVRYDWITLNAYEKDNDTELTFLEDSVKNAKIFATYEAAENYRKAFENYYKTLKNQTVGHRVYTIKDIANTLGIKPDELMIVDSYESMNCLFDSSLHRDLY